MHESAITEAYSLIQSVKGKKQIPQERQEMAISLAAYMLEEAQKIQTSAEKRLQKRLAGMMKDPFGKVFTTAITDQCFRSHRSSRVANQLVNVMKKYGIPRYLPWNRRIPLYAFKLLGQAFSSIAVPLTIEMIRYETSNVILPGEAKTLVKHMQKRRSEGVRVNLNHLGEAILGEEEAKKRLQVYLDDLAKPEVEYISVKISSIFSQINLLAWEETLEALAERLRQLYRFAMNNHYKRPDGVLIPKFVNLDMEEYRDLHLTVALFMKVLNEPEFLQHAAGIVLQSYLPDSFPIQQEMTQWAIDRVKRGGAPIKIRIVKGANLAMEQVESALRGWTQAPYPDKASVDANFKRMVEYGMVKERASAAHLGIGSHNLFDIANALLLRSENETEEEVCFEMLEGMADHMRRVVQELAGGMLLYCPAATKDEFQNAVAYLVRRLDENTAPDNFLRHAFDLHADTPEWELQAAYFIQACEDQERVDSSPRRKQNRFHMSPQKESFQNEPDTDWSLPQNLQWGQTLIHEWKNKRHLPIPLVIDGKEIAPDHAFAMGEDPSIPGQPLYTYALATAEQIDQALAAAKISESHYHPSVEERSRLLLDIAQELRRHRADLIGAMVTDTGKTVFEADVEVSEAIDFATYYRSSLKQWSAIPDIQWKPKGTIVVTPPWNFPCSIPAGGILAALAAGNRVIFKPASEAILVGWHLVQLFWKAGVSRQVLQFITCQDDPVGSKLIQDPRVDEVVLTGATSTAKLFLRMRPDLDLLAETGGKNTMVITAMADRDLAIKDLIHSAFSHAGQKCSACSLAILEAEVYDDPHFRQTLRDAAASLKVGSPWNLTTRLNPLIRPPEGALLRGLTVLEEDEEWLLEPKQDLSNPHLWSPGIKLGVKKGSFTFQTELFGPVLGLVRANDFNHALELMNQTPYGLTAGIHSLDEREQLTWLNRIEAGNCYINRTMTGAIVERQPFGGCKDSSFGKGVKAGGPNYLPAFMSAEQVALPLQQGDLNPFVKTLSKVIAPQDLAVWYASVGNYAYYWNLYFSKDHDPTRLLGEDNILRYVPLEKILFRVQKDDQNLDVLRVIAAALTTQTSLEVSIADAAPVRHIKFPNFIKLVEETDQQLIQRLASNSFSRIRLLKKGNKLLQEAFAHAASHLSVGPVLANGRLELLNMLREVSISRDYHRYGNLGDREHELRRPLPSSGESS